MKSKDRLRLKFWQKKDSDDLERTERSLGRLGAPSPRQSLLLGLIKGILNKRGHNRTFR